MKKEQKPPSKKSVAPTEPKERGMQHRKREYRRDEYAKVDEDPLMKTADLQPRLINIDQFVESRAFELKHFLKILRAKGAPGGKLPFQSLPRHMRRRAMSHNYYRIPLRLRYADTVERIKEKAGDAVGRSRCRKHLRKSRVLLSEYKRRARTTKWLETHIWHAKRFHMTDLWGYKIANHCNDKSERAAYRFAAHDCCIIDKSYFHWIWLKGESKEHLAGLLQKHSYKPVAEMSGKKAFNTLWTDAEGKILAPVVILFNPSSMGTECLVCVHPAGVNDFTTSIQNSSIKYVPLNPSTLCTFQMYGKKAMQAAANVLLPLAVPRQPILNLVESIEDPSILPNNAVIGLKIRKPKSKFRMNERILRKEQNIEELKGADQYVYHKRDCNYSMNSAAPAFLETLLNWDAKFAECGLWDYEYLKKLVIEQPENMKITNRTRFYHKKKKPDLHKLLEKFKLMKVKPSATLAPIKEIEEEKVLSKSELQTVKETTEIEDKKDNNTMWVWIIIESSTTQKHFGSGLKIIFPAGIGLQLWRRLIYAGAKAVGLREQTSILHEKGLFVYPNDFPLTAPYDQMKRAEGVELAIEHYRKPPSKRVNYQKVGFCYPFISLWNDLVPTTEDIAKLRIAPFINREVGTPALYPVHIAMAKRYVPKERATICVCLTKDKEGVEEEPMHDDPTINIKDFNKELEKITGKTSVELYDKEGKIKQTAKPQKRAQRRKDIKRVLHPEKNKDETGIKTEAKPAMEIEEENKVLTKNLKIKAKYDPLAKYKIIGFVTSGRYSLLEGRGHGIGYIVNYLGSDIAVNRGEISAFVRNPNSRLYYPCTAKLVNLPYSF